MSNLETLYPNFIGGNMALKLMGSRMGIANAPDRRSESSIDGINDMAVLLEAKGGFPQ
jgi:hypothetical protein